MDNYIQIQHDIIITIKNNEIRYFLPTQQNETESCKSEDAKLPSQYV